MLIMLHSNQSWLHHQNPILQQKPAPLHNRDKQVNVLNVNSSSHFCTLVMKRSLVMKHSLVMKCSLANYFTDFLTLVSKCTLCYSEPSRSCAEASKPACLPDQGGRGTPVHQLDQTQPCSTSFPSPLIIFSAFIPRAVCQGLRTTHILEQEVSQNLHVVAWWLRNGIILWELTRILICSLSDTVLTVYTV